MKVKLGDIIESASWGVGKIIAMTKIWCIYETEEHGEVAELWEEIYLPKIKAKGPKSIKGSLSEFEIT